jgi:hypothetical protein
MSAGGMFYAIDLGALDADLGPRAPVPPDELVAYLEANAHQLSNTAHMPAPFGAIIDLDNLLEAARYPTEFRYAYMFDNPSSVRMRRADDLPLVGSISADLVAAVAQRARSEGPPHVTDDWQARALDELFRNVQAAAELRFGLVGVYT